MVLYWTFYSVGYKGVKTLIFWHYWRFHSFVWHINQCHFHADYLVILIFLVSLLFFLTVVVRENIWILGDSVLIFLSFQEYINQILKPIIHSALNCPPVMCQIFSELKELANTYFPSKLLIIYFATIQSIWYVECSWEVARDCVAFQTTNKWTSTTHARVYGAFQNVDACWWQTKLTLEPGECVEVLVGRSGALVFFDDLGTTKYIVSL